MAEYNIIHLHSLKISVLYIINYYACPAISCLTIRFYKNGPKLMASVLGKHINFFSFRVTVYVWSLRDYSCKLEDACA